MNNEKIIYYEFVATIRVHYILYLNNKAIHYFHHAFVTINVEKRRGKRTNMNKNKCEVDCPLLFKKNETELKINCPYFITQIIVPFT